MNPPRSEVTPPLSISVAPREKEMVIRPTSSISLGDLRDLWSYRELLWILALRDISVRYKQASLGVAWAVIQPLTQMAIFTVLFNRFAGIRPDGDVPYPVFCFSGLVVWMLFSNGLSYASESLVQSGSLVTKVYFPRVIIPLASVVTALVDFVVSMGLLLVMLLAFRIPFHFTWFLVIPIALVAVLCAVALGLWTSAINIQYRDVRYALPFFIQILVYLTPVFYPSTLVPERYRGLLVLNPMVAVIDSFRAAILGAAVPFTRLALAAATALAVGAAGLVAFRRMERTFADRI
jgi:lipopolysaccharide transport system permease protein